MESHDTARVGRRPRREPWPLRRRAACRVAFGTSLLFLVVYGLTNARAGSLEGLATVCFAWERGIPLVPWMSVPYVSLDLFFVAAPFVCGSRAEIRMLGRRLALAILAAGAVFLFWPLRLGFAREPVDGPFGPIIEALREFDPPHNLFPSLHVTLAFILRWTYHRHLGGGWRWAMHAWFALITVSTLLTHQHHVVDVVGGLVLGLLVLYALPTGRMARRDVRVAEAPDPRLAWVHAWGAAGALAAAVALATRSALGGGLLAWVAVALAIVSLGYAGLGPKVFRKYAGYLSLPARAVLAPYLVGLWLCRAWFWRRDGRSFGRVDDVLFGPLPDRALLAELRRQGVHSFVDLTAEHSAHRVERAMDYASVPMLDLAAPPAAALDEAVSRIEAARTRGGLVYVHCALGYGRSAAVVARWLLATGRAASTAAAAAAVQVARPGAVAACRGRRSHKEEICGL